MRRFPLHSSKTRGRNFNFDEKFQLFYRIELTTSNSDIGKDQQTYVDTYDGRQHKPEKLLTHWYNGKVMITFYFSFNPKTC